MKTNEELIQSMICVQCTCIRVCTNENFNSPCDKYKVAIRVAEEKDRQFKNKEKYE